MRFGHVVFLHPTHAAASTDTEFRSDHLNKERSWMGSAERFISGGKAFLSGEAAKQLDLRNFAVDRCL
jgi:hypothetical protein